MNHTDLNIRFNTLMAVNLLSLILSWVTPYPWWQDALIVLAMGLWMAIPLVWKQE